MKKLFVLMMLAFATTAFLGFKQMEKTYNNIFEQLGLDKTEAESYITGNLFGGDQAFPATRLMAKLAMSKREEAVRQMGDYIKAYAQSPAFLKEYQAARTDQKPEAPTGLYRNAENAGVYKEDLKRWEAEYPAAFNDLLKRRLRDFLSLTADIKFDAKLEPRNGKMVFSDPVLESKDAFWKACFRSGKPTVDAARAYAQQWLSELK